MGSFIDFGRVGEAADLLIEDIRSEMERQNINAKGNLSASLGWRITANDRGLSLSVMADDYWDYAMGGRGPGKIPAGKIPAGEIPGNFVEILQDWIVAKNIPFDGSIRNFAGAIAYNIKNYGSRRYRENNPADVLSGPIEKFLESVGDMVLPENVDLGI